MLTILVSVYRGFTLIHIELDCYGIATSFISPVIITRVQYINNSRLKQSH